MSTANGIDKEFELPHASVARILKSKLPEGVSVSREAKQAFSKSAGIFILYLTAASNEFCKDSKRQTLSAKDILEALRSLDFGDFIEPLEVALDGKSQYYVAPFCSDICFFQICEKVQTLEKSPS
uniref:Transcription factor CBF/NF-Y/archaeal histone domain-containing protein n=1 Tax=Mucochytrium quahogii TaxID=96639 RepID=A0A7S2RPE1_9STRA|mmetsp:Transcript_1817/g.3521  ORF Transcript_1817/g.3521 Transcript_1817/m.3521 type:complete len:125 (+) Transcript_1817:183-557(+)